MKRLKIRDLVADELKTNSDEKAILFLETVEAGLKRIIIDRDSFFHNEEVVDFVRDSQETKICGTALGFIVKNKSLLKVIEENLTFGGRVEFLIAHPNSDIVKIRSSEEQWHGTLEKKIRQVIEKLFEIKIKFSNNVKLYLFKGEIHNTIISTDDVVMVNPYVFGKKGWFSPAFIFNKYNKTIIEGFDDQLDEMKEYGKNNPGTLIEIVNREDLLANI